MSSAGLLDSRRFFPSLTRQIRGEEAVYLDGPAGSQVPQSVILAVCQYYENHNANHGGLFATSQESDAAVHRTQQMLADLFGIAAPEQLVLGSNMTSLTFSISRALSTTWQPGDEILVTQLDHDANVSPWVRAALDRGVTVRHVQIRREDCTLDLDDFRGKLSPRTRLVAFCAVSNAVGTRNPVAQLTKLAHDAGALVYVDAVHHAPHLLIDVPAWGCDFVACSAYKFFGPHVGVVYGRRDLLEGLPAYKVRPCPESLPDRWMTGTQNFACIAGTGAAVNYLAQLGSQVTPQKDCRTRLKAAFEQIEEYEQYLSRKLIEGLTGIPEVTVYGITDLKRLHERVPTVSFTHARKTPREVAAHLGERGIFCWHGNYYALPLTEALGVEPHGMVRVGALHYNTPAEIDRLVSTLREMR